LFAGILVGLVGFTAAGSALAEDQPWLSDDEFGEGNGYQSGSFVLHPGIAGEFGYDSNMYKRASSEDPAKVYVLRFTPSLTVQSLTEEGRQESYRFGGAIAAHYNEYMKAVDTNVNVSSFRNVGVDARVGLTVNPDGRFAGHFYGDVIRSIQPSNLSDTSSTFDRVYLRGGAELIWKPGGGLFDWRLGYELSGALFEHERFSALSHSIHTLKTRGRWQFLPRSSLLFDTSTSFVRYGNTGPNNYLLGSNPLRSRIGFNGLITDRLILLAMAGWGATFFRQAHGIPLENYDGPIGQVQLTYFPTPTTGLPETDSPVLHRLSNATVGYHRDFHSSYYGGFYGRDRGFLRTSLLLARRLHLSGEAGVSNVHYPTLYFDANSVRTGSFNETRWDLSLHAEYRIIPSVGAFATVRYDKNSSIILPITPESTTDVDDLNFDRFRAFLGVRWFM